MHMVVGHGLHDRAVALVLDLLRRSFACDFECVAAVWSPSGRRLAADGCLAFLYQVLIKKDTSAVRSRISSQPTVEVNQVVSEVPFLGERYTVSSVSHV